MPLKSKRLKEESNDQQRAIKRKTGGREIDNFLSLLSVGLAFDKL